MLNFNLHLNNYTVNTCNIMQIYYEITNILLCLYNSDHWPFKKSHFYKSCLVSYGIVPFSLRNKPLLPLLKL